MGLFNRVFASFGSPFDNDADPECFAPRGDSGGVLGHSWRPHFLL